MFSEYVEPVFIPAIEPEFDLFEILREVVTRHATVMAKTDLGEAPEALYAVEVDVDTDVFVPLMAVLPANLRAG